MKTFSIKNKTYGLTLIELISVLAILLITYFITVPSYNHLLKKTQSLHDIRSLFDALHLGRSYAISKQQLVTVCTTNTVKACDKNNGLGIIVFTDTNNNQFAESNEIIYQFQNRNKQALIKLHLSGRRSYIRYKPNGMVKEFGNITYCGKVGESEINRQLVINIGGRVRTVKNQNLKC